MSQIRLPEVQLRRVTSMGGENSLNYFFSPKFWQMKEDLVLYHLAKYKNEIRFFLSFPQQLKGRDKGSFFWWHNLKFRRNTFETVTIMIWRTPLMESMLTYVLQKYLNQPWFQSYGKRSSGSRIIGYGAHVPSFSADVPLFRSLKSVLTLCAVAGSTLLFALMRAGRAFLRREKKVHL